MLVKAKMLQDLKFLCKTRMIIFSEIRLFFYKGRLYENVGDFLLTKYDLKILITSFIFFLYFPLDQNDRV